jgi:hypothetical protein
MRPKFLGYSADYVGLARELIERTLGCMSLFLQANAGDINPITGIGTKEDDSDQKNQLGWMLGGEVLKVYSTIYTESMRAPRTSIGSLAKIPFYPRVKIDRELDYTVAFQEESFNLPLRTLPSQAEAEQILGQCKSELETLLVKGSTATQLNVARCYCHWARGGN